MKIAVIDDYQDAFRTLDCYEKLSGHEVIVYKDTEKDPARLAERLKAAEAVILTQQRSRFPRAVIERLPNLKLVNQTGRNVGHIDVDACTEHGVLVSAGGSGDPHTTAELTWAVLDDGPGELESTLLLHLHADERAGLIDRRRVPKHQIEPQIELRLGQIDVFHDGDQGLSAGR